MRRGRLPPSRTSGKPQLHLFTQGEKLNDFYGAMRDPMPSMVKFTTSTVNPLRSLRNSFARGGYAPPGPPQGPVTNAPKTTLRGSHHRHEPRTMPNTTPIRRGFGQCSVPGCTNTRRSSVAPYCTTHHSQARRHGDPRQTLVTRQELQPFEDRVRKVMATGKSYLIETSLIEITRRLNEAAEAELAQFHRGVPKVRDEVIAYDQIAKVTKSVDPVETATTIAALFLLQDHSPRRFPSDAGMLGQLVRQFRLPAGIARGVSYDRHTNKDVGWFRPLPKKATTIMGHLVVAAYTPWIVHIKKAEERLRNHEHKIARDLARAFDAPETG